MDDEVDNFLRKHEICYDRFTFDKIFRFLLLNDFDHDDAKDLILYNCSLSALVLQERVHNDYYYKIKADDEISEDLLALMKEEENRYLGKMISAINGDLNRPK